MGENKQAQGNDARNEIERLKAEKTALEKELENARKEAEEAREAATAAQAFASEQSAKLDAQVSRQEEAIRRQLGRQRKARIIIASGRDPHERSPVPVAVNGREFLIVRDTPVDVPEGVLNVLDLAVANVAETRDMGQQANTEFHHALRFSYRVLGYVNPTTGELEKA